MQESVFSSDLKFKRDKKLDGWLVGLSLLLLHKSLRIICLSESMCLICVCLCIGCMPVLLRLFVFVPVSVYMVHCVMCMGYCDCTFW